jgi:hypothetical protein
MNLEAVVETQQTPAQAIVEPAQEKELEITPLAFESFKLIGGGSSVVVV